MATSGPVLSSTLVNSPIVDPKTGRLNFAALKYFQYLQQVINSAFQQNGNLAPGITVDGLPAGLAAMLVNIDANGILLSPGIDFSRVYTNQVIKYIADSAPNFPLAGGSAAYAALLASGPAAGQVLEFNGADWVPVTLAPGGVTQILAGTNITLSPPGGTGAVTVNAASSVGYLKGVVSMPFAGNTSGSFTANATIAGATTSMGAIVCANASIDAFVQFACYVSSANTVTVVATLPGSAVHYATQNYNVVVFP